MLKPGDTFTQEFNFSQEEVNQFAALSGDQNPLHLEGDYANNSSFGKPIIHGVLIISVFSQIIGMKFPGEGTIYLGQDIDFKRPAFPGHTYRAELEVAEVIEGKHIASIKTQIFDSENNKIILDGFARIKNKEKVA